MDYLYIGKRCRNRRYMHQTARMAFTKLPTGSICRQHLDLGGNTDKSLGYIHLDVEKPVRANTITIRLKGNTSDKDAFGQIIEVEAKAANTMELEKAVANTS